MLINEVLKIGDFRKLLRLLFRHPVWGPVVLQTRPIDYVINDAL